MDSILNSTKKLVGVDPSCTDFDTDFIVHINSVFFLLYQMGVGPSTPYSIIDSSAVWTDYIDVTKVELIKSYMAIKVRLLFDPPTSSTAVESLKNIASEFEWRMNIEFDKEEDNE